MSKDAWDKADAEWGNIGLAKLPFALDAGAVNALCIEHSASMVNVPRAEHIEVRLRLALTTLLLACLDESQSNLYLSAVMHLREGNRELRDTLKALEEVKP